MYNEEIIRTFANLIVTEINPNKIILFGSYAYGKPTETSDVDILVLKNEDGKSEFSLEEEARLNCRIMNKKRNAGLKVRGDIFLMTETQAVELANGGQSSIKDALQKGIMLYENVN